MSNSSHSLLIKTCTHQLKKYVFPIREAAPFGTVTQMIEGIQHRINASRTRPSHIFSTRLFSMLVPSAFVCRNISTTTKAIAGTMVRTSKPTISCHCMSGTSSKCSCRFCSSSRSSLGCWGRVPDAISQRQAVRKQKGVRILHFHSTYCIHTIFHRSKNHMRVKMAMNKIQIQPGDLYGQLVINPFKLARPAATHHRSKT